MKNLDTMPLFAGMGGHQSARATTDEWLTPPPILEACGGWRSFDLDPSAPIIRPWPMARAHYTVQDNGLTRAWDGRVWLNPPYGRELGRWLARLAKHGTGLALIFARTETDPFFRHVWQAASGLLFLRGRLTFHTVDGKPAPHNGGAPSVLCAYGQEELDRLAACGLDGQLVPLRLPRGVIAAAVMGTWREEVGAWLRKKRGPVSLDELYRAFADHPKAKANPNYTAKIRQVLQQGAGRRVARGEWIAATNSPA